MNIFLRIWTGFSDRKKNNLMTRMLQTYGNLKEGSYTTHRTYIGKDRNDYVFSIHIHTNKPQSVLIVHGYGGTSAMFYKYFAELSRYYNVYALDLRGTGMSGRGTINIETPDQYEKYFVEGIAKYVEHFKLNKIVLIAHSMGAYFSSLYVDSHPDIVDKLVLLSPAGFTKVDQGALNDLYAYIYNMKWPVKGILKKAVKIWQNGESPLALFRKFGMLSHIVLGKYKSMLNMPNKVECSDYLKFVYQVNVQNPCSDKCLGRLITFHGYGFNPLESRVKLPSDTTFIFGEKDWVKTDGVLRYIQDHPSMAIKVVPNAGHNLNIQEVDAVFSILRERKIIG